MKAFSQTQQTSSCILHPVACGEQTLFSALALSAEKIVVCVTGVERGRDREEEKKREVLGKEGKLPFLFSFFALFSLPTPPPLFAPATQSKKIAICAPPRLPFLIQ